MRLGLLVMFVAAAPITSASGTLDMGAAAIMIDNGRDGDCIEDTSGLCLATVSGEGSGTQLNVRQEFRALLIGVNRTFVNDAVGYSLLPDGTLVVDLSDYSTPNPVFRLFVEQIGSQHGPGPAEPFGLVVNETGYAVEYFGPGIYPANTTLDDHSVGSSYPNIANYERIGPINVLESTTTDRSIRDTLTGGCRLLANAPCFDTMSGVANRSANLTPEVVWGVEFLEPSLGLGTGGFGSAETLSNRSSVEGPSTGRPALMAPPGPRADSPPVTPMLARGGTGEPEVTNPPGGDPRDVKPGPLGPAPTGPDLRGGDGIPVLIAISAAFALAVLCASLYSRVTRDRDLLLAGSRARLLELIRQRGPLSLSTLSREIGVDRKTAIYHIRILAKTNQVQVHKLNRQVVVGLPRQTIPEGRGETRRSPSCRRLLTVLAESGGELERGQLVKRLDLPARSRNRALRACIELGEVQRVWRSEGQFIVLRADANAHDVPGSV